MRCHVGLSSQLGQALLLEERRRQLVPASFHVDVYRRTCMWEQKVGFRVHVYPGRGHRSWHRTSLPVWADEGRKLFLVWEEEPAGVPCLGPRGFAASG